MLHNESRNKDSNAMLSNGVMCLNEEYTTLRQGNTLATLEGEKPPRCFLPIVNATVMPNEEN